MTLGTPEVGKDSTGEDSSAEEGNFTGDFEVTGDFSETATFISRKLPRFGMFRLDLWWQKFWQKFAPVWNIWLCHGVAKILTKILPQFGMFHSGFEIAKILTKILPQFGVSLFVTRLQKFCQKFCPGLKYLILVLRISEAPALLWMPEKMLRVVVFPMSFWNNQIYSFLLFNKASNLTLIICAYAELIVSSENELISSIKILTMPLNKNCPSLAICDDVGSWVYFLRLAFEGLYLRNEEYLSLSACGFEGKFRLFEWA